MSFQKLQCIVGPMLNSVFQNSNIHLSKIFYFNISESLSINTVKQIFHFYFHVVYLLGLVFKRASLCNWQQLDLQILYRFSLIYPKYHLILLWFAFIISVFHLLKVNTTTSKQRSSAGCFQGAILLWIDKIKRIKIAGDLMAWFDLL